jgi:hypothetical protein
MELNQSAWYVRLFFWSLGIWEAFQDYLYRYDRSYVEERGTNLCFFIRVTFVYMPLVLLLHIALVVAAVASLTALPIYLFGGIAYGWTLSAIAVVIGIIWGVKKKRALRRVTEHERTQVEFAEHKHGVRPLEEATEPRGPGFLDVLWVYLVATKKKVCPSVAFLAPKKEVH